MRAVTVSRSPAGTSNFCNTVRLRPAVCAPGGGAICCATTMPPTASAAMAMMTDFLSMAFPSRYLCKDHTPDVERFVGWVERKQSPRGSSVVQLRRTAWARRGACHRAALCADPLASLPILRTFVKHLDKTIDV